MDFKCNYCNKNYASYQSRCNHIRRYHKSEVSQNKSEGKLDSKSEGKSKVSIKKIIEDKNYKCIYCNNKYKHKQSKYNHEKKCKNENKKLENEDKIDKMEKEIESLKDLLQKALKIHPKTLQKINNQLNNINNGTINNNTINIIQLGKEDLTKMLTMEEKMSILNRQAMGINDLVKLVHTSGKYQKCMNVYITNLQNTIGYMYDEKQNNFIAVNKNELLNDLVDSRMYDIEKFYDKLQLKLDPLKASRIKKFIDKMKNEEDCLKDLKKEEIKLILYNNKEVISTIIPKISINHHYDNNNNDSNDDSDNDNHSKNINI